MDEPLLRTASNCGIVRQSCHAAFRIIPIRRYRSRAIVLDLIRNWIELRVRSIRRVISRVTELTRPTQLPVAKLYRWKRRTVEPGHCGSRQQRITQP